MNASHFIRRHLRVLGPLASVLLVVVPIAAQEVSTSRGTDVDDVAAALIGAGTPAPVARVQAAALTDADRRVLLDHPEMVQSAGRTDTTIELSDAPVLDPILHLHAILVAAEVVPEQAWAQLQSLTLDDVRVLLAHPGMLQRAGTMSHMDEAVLIGVLILAGIVALAASGSGFVSIH